MACAKNDNHWPNLPQLSSLPVGGNVNEMINENPDCMVRTYENITGTFNDFDLQGLNFD